MTRVQEVDHPPVDGVHRQASLPRDGLICQAGLLALPRTPPPPPSPIHVEEEVEEGEEEGKEREHRGDVIAVDRGGLDNRNSESGNIYRSNC